VVRPAKNPSQDARLPVLKVFAEQSIRQSDKSAIHGSGHPCADLLANRFELWKRRCYVSFLKSKRCVDRAGAIESKWL
jgi:hypothetical protein